MRLRCLSCVVTVEAQLLFDGSAVFTGLYLPWDSVWLALVSCARRAKRAPCRGTPAPPLPLLTSPRLWSTMVVVVFVNI